MLLKKWIFNSVDETTVQNLQKELGIDRIFCQLLVQRGITTFDQAKRFFRPSMDDLHDPFLMKDMDAAVARLEKAIIKKEKILLYGDYDVDGTTSVAMMYDFLSTFTPHLDYYIPDRYKEGYGISMQGIEYAEANSQTLVIAMDCGIQATEKVELARQKGIDFIICDHHLPSEKIPAAVAVLDPKRSDCTYPYKELSGCGVAFKLAQAYAQRRGLPFEGLENLLDLVVVSISCDIVPITDENRVLAFFGLKKINDQPREGLKALIDLGKRTFPLSISDIVFGIGPMINAAGRLADAKLAVQLLLASDREVAHAKAEALNYKNDQRKELEKTITEDAIAAFRSLPEWEEHRTIALFDANWHKGVVGIVASRMVEHFHRPTIILTASEGKIVGSARSVGGYDLHATLKECDDLLVNWGGHAHAAGVTLVSDNLQAFQKRFEYIVSKNISPELLLPKVKIDAILNFGDFTPKFWRILKQFAPFGPQNMRPVFCSEKLRDSGGSRLLKEKHLKLSLNQANHPTQEAIAFDMSHFYAPIKNRHFFDCCYTIEENIWQGKASLQLHVKDIRFAENK